MCVCLRAYTYKYTCVCVYVCMCVCVCVSRKNKGRGVRSEVRRGEVRRGRAGCVRACVRVCEQGLYGRWGQYKNDNNYNDKIKHDNYNEEKYQKHKMNTNSKIMTEMLNKT